MNNSKEKHIEERFDRFYSKFDTLQVNYLLSEYYSKVKPIREIILDEDKTLVSDSTISSLCKAISRIESDFIRLTAKELIYAWENNKE